VAVVPFYRGLLELVGPLAAVSHANITACPSDVVCFSPTTYADRAAFISLVGRSSTLHASIHPEGWLPAFVTKITASLYQNTYPRSKQQVDCNLNVVLRWMQLAGDPHGVDNGPSYLYSGDITLLDRRLVAI
jgi:hypothetical protein